MAINNIVKAIIEKHEHGILVNPLAGPNRIYNFERRIGFILPGDFIEFYTICNGFECNEDLFNMVCLSEIDEYGSNWFYFAEYMIYSDMWGLRLTGEGKYEIFNGSYPAIAMTSSLEEFLNRFLRGGVFETGGLYDWHEELEISGS